MNINKALAIVSTAVVAAFCQPVYAADMALKAPPPAVAPAPSWTGWYVGLNAGGDWSSANYNANPNTIGFGAGLGAFSPAGAADTASVINGRVTNGSFTGGGQIGYNYQMTNWLAGLEADFEYTGAKGSAGPNKAPIFGAVTTESYRANWLNTDRARLGYIYGPWLVYGTGGLAVANVQASVNAVLPPPGFAGALAGTAVVGSNSTTRAGWAAGGGIEWKGPGHWTFRVEDIYAGLGKINVLSTNTSAANPLSFINTSVKFNENLIRAAVNYAF